MGKIRITKNGVEDIMRKEIFEMWKENFVSRLVWQDLKNNCEIIGILEAAKNQVLKMPEWEKEFEK